MTDPQNPDPAPLPVPSKHPAPPEVERTAPPAQRRVIRQHAAWQIERSPLLTPKTLAEYDEIVPGTAKALVESFVKEGEHRRHQEERSMDAQIDRQKADITLEGRAQLIGGLSYLLTLALGAGVIATGSSATGIAILVGVTAIFAVALISGRRRAPPGFYDEPVELIDEEQAAETGTADAITNNNGVG